MNLIKILMVNRYVLLSLVLILVPIAANAQVADITVGGIIVPKFTSTQNQYCSNGSCSTGGTPPIPKNYTISNVHLPILLISLSQTCEVLNKHNMTGCPSVESLIHYDNSNQMISGKFVNNNGIYFRTPPQMKNNWLAYQNSDHTIICVECTFDVAATSKSKQIIIEPSSFTYVNKTETENKNSWYNFKNRYMQGCDIATISNIPGLLPDTANFMLSGCQQSSTQFNTVETHTRILHPFMMNSPYSSLVLDSNLKQIFLGHFILHNEKMPTMGGLGPANCQTGQCSLTTSTKKW